MENGCNMELNDIGWNFDNSYAELPGFFYTKISPTPVANPSLVLLNDSLAEKLGLKPELLKSREAVLVFSGNKLPPGAEPLAQAYAGHQFGHFTMLGDGRAILLGEQITPQGERYDLQLKGSGRTPYSRGGDGRAALGPMLREFIISEAMYALGIPTTRSLAVVTTGEKVVRETILPGAILTRVAASHIRVGTFEYISQWGNEDDLKILADYTIKRHYDYINNTDKRGENSYILFLREVIKRQASLIAQWQLIGFIHGVMNTDNMAISGETIDYGPCAFMDTYDPATVFSSIDRHGRYAYGNQPYIAAWNIARLADTLLPLLHKREEEAIEIAEIEIGNFFDLFQANWLQGMRAKLGLFNEEDEDEALIVELLEKMKKNQGDYTNTFLALTFAEEINSDKSLGLATEDLPFIESQDFLTWKRKWLARISRQQESKEAVHRLMKKTNPALIPRNHRVEEVLKAAVEEGDYVILQKFLKALAKPYEHLPEQTEYRMLPAPSSCPYRTFCGT